MSNSLFDFLKNWKRFEMLLFVWIKKLLLLFVYIMQINIFLTVLKLNCLGIVGQKANDNIF